MIWKKEFTIAGLNQANNNMMAHLDIRYETYGPDFLTASMPVDHRTQQPFGLLHGGASAVLIETLGSLSGYLCLPDDGSFVVGLDIHVNHLSAATSGRVFCTIKPERLGRSIQLWTGTIVDENDKKIATGRLTTMVRQAKK